MPESGVRLHVEADLSMSVEGVDGTLSGSGSELEFSTDDLTPYFAGSPGAVTGARAVVARLTAAGVSMDVVERGRPILSVGADRASVLGRLLGTPHLTAHRPLRLLRLVLSGR